MKITPQNPDNGAVITLANRAIFLTWKQLYELAVELREIELCHECYRSVEIESSMGNGYHPGCYSNMMDRLLAAEEHLQITPQTPKFSP